MTSNAEEILNEIFGEAKPDWNKVLKSAEGLNNPVLTLVEILGLMWLDQNEPEKFDEVIDEAIMNEL